MLVNIGSGNGLVPSDTKQLPEPMLTYHQSHESNSTKMLVKLMIGILLKLHIWCESHIPKGQWVYSLRPSDALWWHRSGSTWAQIMAWCLVAPSHYLNQCWLLINEVLWHSPESDFTSAQANMLYNWFESCTFKIITTFLGGQWVNIGSRLYRLAAHASWCLLLTCLVKKIPWPDWHDIQSLYGVTVSWINPMIPGRCRDDYKNVIFNLMLHFDTMKISRGVAMIWMLQNLIDD